MGTVNVSQNKNHHYCHCGSLSESDLQAIVFTGVIKAVEIYIIKLFLVKQDRVVTDPANESVYSWKRTANI